MNIYVILGIIALALICIYMVMKKNKNKNGKKKKNIANDRSIEGRQKEGEPTEEQMIEMEQRLQEILAYDLADEEKITAQLPNMSVEDMAKYADKITLKNINDAKFSDAFVPEDLMERLMKAPLDDEEERRLIINPSVMGNLSYISLNAGEPYAERAKMAVEFLKGKL